MKPSKLTLQLRSLILGLSALAPLGFPAVAKATDGQWISMDASNTWSDSTNWASGTIADGADSTVKLTFFPFITGNGVTADQGANVQLDTSRTQGHLIFEDLDNYGSSSIGMQNPTAAATTLTLQTTTGVPSVLVGQNINSVVGGKKAIIPNTIDGTGWRKTGPGYLGVRAFNASTSHPWSGDFLIEGGLLELSAQTTYAGTTAVRGGSTLFLSFSQANCPATNPISTSSVLSLGSDGSGGAVRGGGVVVNNNKAATSNAAQTFASTTINEGVHEIRAVTAANQNMAYTLGAVTRNPHSTLHFQRSATAGTGTITASVSNGSDGIIGAWATYATGAANAIDWAFNNGSDQIASFAGYTANTWASGNHTNVTLDAALNGATTRTLRFALGSGVTLGLTGTNTIEAGGLLVVQQSPLITGGTLTTGDASGDFMLHSYGGGLGLRLSSTIADNGSPVRLIKAGTGNLTITSTPSHTGGTYVGAGVLMLGDGFGGGATGSLPGDVFLNAFNNGGGAFNPSGTLAVNRSGTYILPNTLTGSGNLAQYSTGTLVLDKQHGMRSLQAFAGTTKLDFSAAGAPASEIINSIDTAGTASLATAHLHMRNAKLDIAGKDGAANVQSFGLTSVTGAARIAAAAGAGGSLQVNLGALGRFNNSNDSGGTLRIDAGPGVTVTAPNGGTAGNTQAGGAILDVSLPWVTWGDSDWAAKDLTPFVPDLATSSINVVSGSSVANFYTPTSISLAGNADVDSAAVVGAPTTLTSLRFNSPTHNSLTASAAFEPRGILVTPNVGANDVLISGAGPLLTNYIANNTARDLIVVQNNAAGRLVISTPITNGVSGTNITRTTLVKSGPGDLVFENAAHTYTDRTLVNEGRLIFGSGAVLGTSAARAGSLLSRGGEIVLESNAQVFTGAFHSSGQRIGENATLTLKDSALFDISADFNMGDVWAKGTLNMQDSARAVVKSLFLGKSGFAEGIVNLSGNAVLTAGNTPSADWNLGGNGAGDPSAKGTVNLSGNAEFDSGNQNFQVGRNGIGEFNITGGTYRGAGFNVIGRFHSAVGTWNVSGGTLNATTTTAPGVTPAPREYLIVAEEGRGTLNVSGTGLVLARSLSIGHNGGIGTVNVNGGTVDLTATGNLTNTQAGIVFGAGNVAPAFFLPGGPAGTVNFNGGVVKLNAISERTGATFTSAVNFNGSTLQAIAGNTAFMAGLDSATAMAGGLTLDTAGFDVTIGQTIQHDATLGATLDGGLTKSGAGKLTLTAAQTFTGPVKVTAGTVANDVSLAGGAEISAGATLTGCGTIAGAIVNNGTLLIDCGGTVTLSGPITNNGRIEVKNNTTLVVTGPVTNNGAVVALTGTFSPASITGSGPVIEDIGLISHAPSGADYTVTVESVTGYTYTLETTTTLAAGSWVPAATAVSGTGSPLVLTHTGGAPGTRRFYRVTAQ